ncbi:M48 family metalloprotease [Sansalvadorimonas verongulae]|uniref:M48 family metalloprotease n=1 Tax=Sansalvadorimonas verongulae TaxID=2172824 RepID=UPI0012BD466E|nr:M48 family metalloprotease [Sansalvadorimonas verongulae]MTI13747.1 M48 family peptidase [Sansalvadorimonas verongulae]
MALFKTLPTVLRSFLLPLALTASTLANSEITLPTIGDASSSIVSIQKEREIGGVFLKMLNSQLSTESDPELVEYVEKLVYRLAESSQLQNRELSIVLIDSPYLNAFAAPGGIVGINLGLFFYARTEDEFAGVVAHELAHLSQRHYARGVETAQRQRLPTIAALLGSIVLAASGAGDLGAAALSSTVAGAQSYQLAFSRINEQEADRVGILTMARAGMDPRGMATLFERMSKLEGTGPQYEFLRTHPLSRNRVSDARSRAEQYPAKPQNPDGEYQLMRNRAIIRLAQSQEDIRNRFQKELNSSRSGHENATRYGLAQAELNLQNPKGAKEALQPLLASSPNNIHYQILHNRILFESGDHKTAISNLRKLLSDNPGNYPTTLAIVDLLYNDRQYSEAMSILRTESRRRPDDSTIWYNMAETAGLAGDILTVHTSRSQYFFLVGDMDNSVKHLEYALELPNVPFSQRAALKERIEEVKDYKKKMKL